MKVQQTRTTFKKETQKGTCAVRAAGLLNHKAAYMPYTAHYWYVPEPFKNLLFSSKLLW